MKVVLGLLYLAGIMFLGGRMAYGEDYLWYSWTGRIEVGCWWVTALATLIGTLAVIFCTEIREVFGGVVILGWGITVVWAVILKLTHRYEQRKREEYSLD